MKTRWLLLLAAAVAALHCGRNPNDGTGSSTESITAMLYNPGGTPAASAKVCFYRHGDDPRNNHAVDSTYTDNNGNYSKDLDSGTYNILASLGTNATFQDSIVVIEGDTTKPPPDTLRTLGSISGRIEMQGTDDPRTVFILFMGSNTFTRPVDLAGNFSAANMAKGKYAVTLLTTLDDYDVMDTSFVITAGVDSIIPQPIVMKYTGIPVPKGLRIVYDSMEQIVTLVWDKPTTGTVVQGYNIYRKHQDSAIVLLRGDWRDTVYRDSTGMQDITYEYRVAAIDTNTMEGTRSGAVSITVTSAFAFVKDIRLDSLRNDPIAFVIGPDTTFYVAYRGNSYNSGFVGVFDNSGHNTKIIGAGKFTQLFDVALDLKGNIYTADPDRNRMLKFNNQGDSIAQWQIQGADRILTDALDNLFVLHNYNPYLITKFDSLGNTLATDTAISYISGVAIGPDNKIYVMGTYETYVSFYDNNLSAKNYLPFVLGAAYSALLNIDSHGNFYIIDGNMDYGKISVFDSVGKKIAQWRPGVPFSRIYLAGNKIYVLGNNSAVNMNMEIIRVFSSPF
jgi:hypothetical protein